MRWGQIFEVAETFDLVLYLTSFERLRFAEHILKQPGPEIPDYLPGQIEILGWSKVLPPWT